MLSTSLLSTDPHCSLLTTHDCSLLTAHLRRCVCKSTWRSSYCKPAVQQLAIGSGLEPIHSATAEHLVPTRGCRVGPDLSYAQLTQYTRTRLRVTPKRDTAITAALSPRMVLDHRCSTAASRLGSATRTTSVSQSHFTALASMGNCRRAGEFTATSRTTPSRTTSRTGLFDK